MVNIDIMENYEESFNKVIEEVMKYNQILRKRKLKRITNGNN